MRSWSPALLDSIYILIYCIICYLNYIYLDTCGLDLLTTAMCDWRGFRGWVETQGLSRLIVLVKTDSSQVFLFWLWYWNTCLYNVSLLRKKRTINSASSFICGSLSFFVSMYFHILCLELFFLTQKSVLFILYTWPTNCSCVWPSQVTPSSSGHCFDKLLQNNSQPQTCWHQKKT